MNGNGWPGIKGYPATIYPTTIFCKLVCIETRRSSGEYLGINISMKLMHQFPSFGVSLQSMIKGASEYLSYHTDVNLVGSNYILRGVNRIEIICTCNLSCQ